MSTFPTLFATGNWYTTSYISQRLNKPLRTVQYWCRNGLFLRRGCKVAFTSDWRGGRCWVLVPPMSKDAMLLPLLQESIDTPPIERVS